ncbi:MAG: type II toxin-antitoxin system RelE/ParE family toxin [bacterium]
MIKSFKNNKLKKAFLKDDFSGILPEHIEKCRLILSSINMATDIADLNRPSFSLHRLKGNREGIWAITVRANWRITFKFENGSAYILDYEDYH